VWILGTQAGQSQALASCAGQGSQTLTFSTGQGLGLALMAKVNPVLR
jgi:hypothetical protein